ncbi:MAG: ABC transporter substrate-binding protein [Opitutales bacterium]
MSKPEIKPCSPAPRIWGLVCALGLALTVSACQEKPPAAHDTSEPSTLEILLVGDPFAYVFEENWGYLAELLDQPINLTLRRYGDTLETIRKNRRDLDSFYHIVSYDISWLGELAEKGALQALEIEQLEQRGLQLDDYYPATLQANRFDGELYGLPIQPHTELLWYRRDLLEEAGFELPATFSELLRQAAFFHKPEEGFYGICWNGLRGDALGQTVAHLYAAHGQPMMSAEGELAIDTPVGQRVARLLVELKAVSPPDILTMAWDQRVERFAQGRSAFTYGWASRNYLVEKDPRSSVRGKVGYAAPPVYSGAENPQFPLGQWSLGIPANLTKAESLRAEKALAMLLSDDVLARFMEEGIGGLNRQALPDALPVQKDPTAAISRELAEGGKLSPNVRPSHTQWPQIVSMCGVVFHEMLKGKLPPEAALAQAQRNGETILHSDETLGNR